MFFVGIAASPASLVAPHTTHNEIGMGGKWLSPRHISMGACSWQHFGITPHHRPTDWWVLSSVSLWVSCRSRRSVSFLSSLRLFHARCPVQVLGPSVALYDEMCGSRFTVLLAHGSVSGVRLASWVIVRAGWEVGQWAAIRDCSACASSRRASGHSYLRVLGVILAMRMLLFNCISYAQWSIGPPHPPGFRRRLGGGDTRRRSVKPGTTYAGVASTRCGPTPRGGHFGCMASMRERAIMGYGACSSPFFTPNTHTHTHAGGC